MKLYLVEVNNGESYEDYWEWVAIVTDSLGKAKRYLEIKGFTEVENDVGVKEIVAKFELEMRGSWEELHVATIREIELNKEI